MGLITKTIAITEEQDKWLQHLLASGAYDDESEIIRALIQQKQGAYNETEAEILAIRAALEEAEKSETVPWDEDAVLAEVRASLTDG